MTSLIGSKPLKHFLPTSRKIQSSSQRQFLRHVHHRVHGFTLFEILITLVILTVGIVFIYKALIMSLNYQSYLVHRIYANNLLDHKIASIQYNYALQDIEKEGEVPIYNNGEVYEAVINNKPLSFQFIADFSQYDNLDTLFLLNLSVNWADNGRTYQISKSAYISQ